MKLTKDYYEDLAITQASRYRDMRDTSPGSAMYHEVVCQYLDMAKGGDGGPLGYWPEDWAAVAVSALRPVTGKPTCRAYNYPTHPNRFFGRVLELLGEDY